MPELPEVETTCRGIAPHLEQHTISDIVIRNASLRWPIAADIKKNICNKKIIKVNRRAKYILINLTEGVLIIHLGMSGRLHVLPDSQQPIKHDHVDIVLNNNMLLRYNDARRFGSIHWTPNCPSQHFLLKNLGVEPLTSSYNAALLLKLCLGRKTNIKQLLMNHNLIVGIGNIYASETLFLASVCPQKSACNITRMEANKIVDFSKEILRIAIENGGTTLKDFLSSDGKPGYFQNHLRVYGREGLPCLVCGSKIKKIVQGQRATFFCDKCQS